MKPLTSLLALALLPLGIVGCGSTERESPAPAASATQPSATPEPTAPPTVSPARHGYVALHATEHRRLLAKAEPSDLGMDALAQGALAVNERGCFGLSDEEGRFSAVVFPHGTEIAGDGRDAGIAFEGLRFALGDVLALGGGGVFPEEGSPEQTALEACGFSEGAFAAWDRVQLLADFEREHAERPGE